jgi:predicted tellurium resistance membrane protein TerC
MHEHSVVVYTSNLLSILMDRYPLILVVGGAVLGRVGGQMIMTDPYVLSRFAPGAALEYGVQALCTVGVVATGKLWMRWRVAKAEREAEGDETAPEGESSRAGRCCPSARRR